MDDFCGYCQRPCGPNGFCDETCYQEYNDERAMMQAEFGDDLPGESRYAGEWEPEEWDVVGGL